jgi:hypothetical protein
MIQHTFHGWALVVKWTDGTEKITVLESLHPKETSNHAEDMLKSEQKMFPDKSFRLINVKIDITEVSP